MKTTTHRLMITVTFDRPVYHYTARNEARNEIHGRFYCGENPDKAESFRVRSIKPIPQRSK